MRARDLLISQQYVWIDVGVQRDTGAAGRGRSEDASCEVHDECKQDGGVEHIERLRRLQKIAMIEVQSRSLSLFKRILCASTATWSLAISVTHSLNQATRDQEPFLRVGADMMLRTLFNY